MTRLDVAGPMLVLAALLSVPSALPASATVVVSGPSDGSAYFPLDMPTGQFDERGLSGFEFFISSTTGQFSSNDQYLIQGEDTDATHAIANDLGAVADLSGVPFAFSIRHNLVGGRNFTFSLTDTSSSQVSVLCWGQNCAAGSTSAETINGLGPILDYNGIQVQVRAQGVAGSSAAVQILGLSGVTTSGEALFDETVVPTSPGTIFAGDRGRRGQWFMAEHNDLTAYEWELFGIVTLNRTDAALTDRNKVRLAVDLVRDPNLPFVPEPATGVLLGLALAGLGAHRRSSLRRSALAAALLVAGSAQGASLSFLDVDPAPSRFATLLSPDGTLVMGAWVNPSGVGDVEGVRWTFSGGAWTRSPGAGVQHPDQDLVFVHDGLARTNELVYSQYAGAPGLWRSPGGVPGGTQVPLPASADPGCELGAPYTGAEISADGTAIVAPTSCGVFRWTAATGSEFITPIGVDGLLHISDDGRTVVGDEGFLWTEAGGYAPLSITLAEIAALSGDGSTIGGRALVAGQSQAVVWDAIHGTTVLGDLPSGDRTRQVIDLSAEGDVAIGVATFGGFEQAFAWTRDGSAVGLGRQSRAIAMTPDGRIVVGELLDVAQGGDRVFVWNLETGVMRTLGAILADFGIDDAPGAGLFRPTGISDDGTTIAGNGGLAGFNELGGGIYVGAWVAVIPEPGTAALVALGVAGLGLFRNGARRD